VVMLATVQSKTFLSSRLLSKNLNIRMHKAIILPVVLYCLVSDIKGGI
jgi:hypothetical protein